MSCPTVVEERNKLGARMGDFTLRRAGREDAEVIAALFHSVYPDSSHPFRSLPLVTQFLGDWRNFQIAAEVGGRWWRAIGQCRYDCVQLTRRLFSGEPATRDIGDWLEDLNPEFRRMPYLGIREGEGV